MRSHSYYVWVVQFLLLQSYYPQTIINNTISSSVLDPPLLVPTTVLGPNHNVGSIITTESAINVNCLVAVSAGNSPVGFYTKALGARSVCLPEMNVGTGVAIAVTDIQGLVAANVDDTTVFAESEDLGWSAVTCPEVNVGTVVAVSAIDIEDLVRVRVDNHKAARGGGRWRHPIGYDGDPLRDFAGIVVGGISNGPSIIGVTRRREVWEAGADPGGTRVGHDGTKNPVPVLPAVRVRLCSGFLTIVVASKIVSQLVGESIVREAFVVGDRIWSVQDSDTTRLLLPTVIIATRSAPTCWRSSRKQPLFPVSFRYFGPSSSAVPSKPDWSW